MAASKKPADRLKALLKWFEQRGVTHEPTISIEADSDGAIAVFAKPGCNINEGTVLCSIPKERAILSKRTTSLADLLEGGQESLRIGGGLALIAAAMHEVSLGSASQW